MSKTTEWTRRGTMMAAASALGLPFAMSARGDEAGRNSARTLSPGGWALSSTRLALPTQKSAPTRLDNRFQRSKIYLGAPTWKGRNWRFLLPNLHVRGGDVKDGDNSIQLVYLTLFNSAGVAFPITLGGQASFEIPAGGLVWSDPVPGFENGPEEALHVLAEVSLAVGQTCPIGYAATLGGSDLGEGRASSAASDPGPRAHGRLAPAQPSNGLSWGPAAAACEGWDGSKRVFLIFGDSRDYGVNDMDYQSATRGCSGAAARGLDEPTSGRVAFANFSIPGARAETLPRNWGKLWGALDELPNQPFHDVIFSLNGNDANGGQYPTEDRIKGFDLALYDAVRRKAPGCRIYHLLGYPWVGDANRMLYSTVEDQTPVFTAAAPDGVAQKIDDWLRSRVGLPDDVVPIDVRPAMADPGRNDRWPAPGIWGTLQRDVTDGRTIIVNLPEPPSRGDNLVVTVGRPMAETFHVSDVSGAGPYTITTVEGVAKYHMVGDKVALAHVRDGVHPGTKLNMDAAGILARAKISGLIRLR